MPWQVLSVLKQRSHLSSDSFGCLLMTGASCSTHNAPLSELVRFPYLLLQNNHLTVLIVYHTHAFLSQAGAGSTLTAIHQSFWIPSRRQYVKKCYGTARFAENIGETICCHRIATTPIGQSAGCTTVLHHWCGLYRSPLCEATQ